LVNINDPLSVEVGVATPGALSLRTGLIKNANCLVVSEAHDGAAAGARVVFGVILGTGEWGHNPLPQFEKKQIVRDDNPSQCYQPS
jgi:fructokinase